MELRDGDPPGGLGPSEVEVNAPTDPPDLDPPAELPSGDVHLWVPWVRVWLKARGATPDRPGFLDLTDPANLHPDDPYRLNPEAPAVAAYLDQFNRGR